MERGDTLIDESVAVTKLKHRRVPEGSEDENQEPKQKQNEEQQSIAVARVVAASYFNNEAEESGSDGVPRDDNVEGGAADGDNEQEDDSIITSSENSYDSSSIFESDKEGEKYHDKKIGADGMVRKTGRLLRGVAVTAAVRGPLKGETPVAELTEHSDTSLSLNRGPGRGTEFENINEAAKDCRERMLRTGKRSRLESSSSENSSPSNVRKEASSSWQGNAPKRKRESTSRWPWL